MVRSLVFLTATAALTIATMLLLLKEQGLRFSSTADAETLVPTCPQPHYYADGNVGPLFCVIDNPVALRFYMPLGKQTFALGSDVDPGEVVNALIDDYKHHATEPELCAVYQLAAWRRHWHFATSPALEVGQRLNFPPNWCSEPRFEGVSGS